jgi:hypothetical protein
MSFSFQLREERKFTYNKDKKNRDPRHFSKNSGGKIQEEQVDLPTIS